MHTTQAKSLLFILFIATAGCFNAQNHTTMITTTMALTMKHIPK